MKIKEQDGQHMVITPSIGDWLSMLAILACAILCGTLFIFLGMVAIFEFNAVPFQAGGIVIGTGLALWALGWVVGNRVVIDRSTQTITVEKRPFLLIHRQRVVPFSDVRSVVIDYEAQERDPGTSSDAWKVSLDIGEKVEIDHTTNKANMLHLASEISRFIGCDLVDNSAKHGSSFTGLFRKVKGFFRKGDEGHDASFLLEMGNPN